MSRKSVFILLFGAVFLGGLVTTTPLSFALNLSGAAKSGLQWQSASGTIWNGRLIETSYRGQQPLGDIDLNAKPLAFLSGELGYSISWDSITGTGRGDVFLGRTSMRVSNLDVQVRVASLINFIQDIRATNAIINIQNANLAIKGGNCSEASGDISSDLLVKLAQRFEIAATELTGNISCDSDELRLLVAGQLGQGDEVTGEGHIRLAGLSRLNAHVRTTDIALGLGLQQYGFEEDSTGYRLQSEVSLSEGF